MVDELSIDILIEIRNWIRAASFTSIRSHLESSLPDAQSRMAYQLFDGSATMESVRVASKMSPNKLVALTQRWSAMGLMEMTADKKKKRLFDLIDFGLIAIDKEN